MLDSLPDYVPIGDYAVIGNCHTAALVSRHGSIDWWCPFRFDGPSLFAALLDPDQGGRWWIGPRTPYEARHAYVEDTNVLVTTFRTASGVLELTDFMPMREGKGGGADGIEPRIGIVRLLRCLEGAVEAGCLYEPRWDYGRRPARLVDRGRVGIFATRRGDAITLRSELPLEIQDGRRAVGTAVLRAGETRAVALSFATGEPLILPPLGRTAEHLLETTANWWRDWLSQCRYQGAWRGPVHRSALALKLLCYAPSGAVVAAPTTSLPEELGGERNWDYRYCWLRDASMTLRALTDLGFSTEARQFFDWLIQATQQTAPRLQVMYEVFGNEVPRERTLDWLRGYGDSQPVRVGNAAAKQLQLDLYGEVISAALAYVHRGGELGRFQARLLASLGDQVCRTWREPDAGIWEIRAEPRQHTHSKVNCWRAMDGLRQLAEAGQLGHYADLPHYKQVAADIREAVEREGWNAALGSYVSFFGSDAVDASLLLMGVQGFLPANHPRMRSTFRHLSQRLSEGPLWVRYRPEAFGDGLAGDEGAFGLCSFWAVEFLAKAGRRDEAIAHFEALLGYANDVGLYAEEIGPGGAPLGNFPQGFTHLGLISAAHALAGQPRGPSEVRK